MKSEIPTHSEIHPPSSESLILGDQRGLYHLGCTAVMDRLHELFPEATSAFRTPVSALQAERLIINGEGSLHSNRPVISTCLDLAEARIAAGKPTSLINFTWQKNDPTLTRRLAAFTHLFTRETASALEIEKHLGHQIPTVPDIALGTALQLPPIQTNPANPPLVNDSTDAKLTKTLRHLAAGKNWPFSSLLEFPTNPRPGPKAAKIFRRVHFYGLLGPLAPLLASQRYLSHLHGPKNLADFHLRCENSSGLLTGRFHAVCFALAWRLPFLALASNTSKISRLLHDAGLYPTRLVSEKNLHDLTHIPPFSEPEAQNLETYLATVLKKQKDMALSILSQKSAA